MRRCGGRTTEYGRADDDGNDSNAGDDNANCAEKHMPLLGASNGPRPAPCRKRNFSKPNIRARPGQGHIPIHRGLIKFSFCLSVRNECLSGCVSPSTHIGMIDDDEAADDYVDNVFYT